MVQEQEQEPTEENQLDQDQAALDGEPGQTPQYITADQMQQMFTQFQSTVTGQLQGFQSKQDKGLNAIRRDTVEQAQRDLENRMMQTRQEVLSTFAENPEQQASLRRMWEMEDLRSQASRVPMQPEPEPVIQQAQNPLEAVHQFVESQGLQRNDPNINYGVLQRGDLSEQERQTVFGQSLGKAHAAKAQRPVPQQPNGQQRTSSPPVEGAPVASGGYRSIDGIRDAYIEGRLDLEAAQQAATKMGGTL
jgi:hypothetical protein